MKIKTDSDLKLLEQKIRPIIGQVCWQARLGYGGELCLEIGKKIPYNSPLLRDEYKGEWQFGSRGSNWKLVGDGFIHFNNLEKEKLSSKLKIIEGTKITKFAIAILHKPHRPRFSELIIEFDEKYILELFISIHTSDGTFIGFNSSDRDLRDMSYWELFMPNNRIIEFYPDLTWSDQPSDVLVEELVNT
ncbi:MAG: hypothetical protein KA717_05785 [Woronichinia naegeliana WA131]|jgi:hypothetical protein|uniref:Uncharacterized protein n=1 Tax=Woronichinia naegeliana WA131 TaxID=2824559 RepID=A0A977L0E8_9CYAN|nr:MAG: hypothetical protein KA717_05785 [Woronichinia naegeliana WA131]